MEIRTRRLAIFKQVENGELSLDEASRRLEDLERFGIQDGQAVEVGAAPTTAAAQSLVPPAAEVIEPMPAAQPGPTQVVEPEPGSQPEVLRGEPLPSNGAERGASEQPPHSSHNDWWLLIFVPGLLLSVAAASWMLQGFQAAGLSWGFWLSFIPFGIGVVMLWLGWEIHLARWFHLHIHQREGARPSEITIAFPLPTGLIRWGIHTFGQFGSPLHGRDVDGILDELNQAVAQDGPVHISVNDAGGEQVEIWIDAPRG